MPHRTVCSHRDLTRTARFVADASGLTTLDLMHAPQSSPAFSLRSEVSMLPAPWHTRPLRPSWHVGKGSRGQAPYRWQTSLRSVAVGAACGMASSSLIEPQLHANRSITAYFFPFSRHAALSDKVNLSLIFSTPTTLEF